MLRLAGVERPHHSLGLVLQAAGRLGAVVMRPTRRYTAREAAQKLDVARAFRHSAEVCYFNNDMLGMICDSVSAVA